MAEQLIPSNPEDVMVIRHITPNVVTFSVPFARHGIIRIGGRGTLVKLSSGTLAVFSPVALTEAAKTKVAELGGNLGYIVALDIEHHIFISQWSAQYPNAKIIGPEGLQEKRLRALDSMIGKEPFAVQFTKAGKRDVRISEEFDANFDYEYMDGHANREIIFNFRPDGILIEADLMFNLPPIEQYSRVPQSEMPSEGFIAKLFTSVQSTAGEATWMKRFHWYLAMKDRESFNDSIKIIDHWDFATIIPCHGETIDGNGKEIFRKAFAWHLADDYHHL